LWTVAEDPHNGTLEIYVIEEEVALYRRRVRRALRCGTWGEIRAMDPAIYEEMVLVAPGVYLEGYDPEDVPVDDDEWEARDGFGPPPDLQSFDLYPFLARAWEDEWMPAIGQLMAALPAELLGKFRAKSATPVRGDWASLDLDRLDEILTWLSDHGFEPVETPWLAELLDDPNW